MRHDVEDVLARWSGQVSGQVSAPMCFTEALFSGFPMVSPSSAEMVDPQQSRLAVRERVSHFTSFSRIPSPVQSPWVGATQCCKQLCHPNQPLIPQKWPLILEEESPALWLWL